MLAILLVLFCSYRKVHRPSLWEIKNMIKIKKALMNIIKYKSIPSTNTKAKELILSGVREGVLLAEKQTAGRGRLGRSFYSENGLFTSIILAPNAFTVSPSFLTSAAAVAVCRVLRKRGLDIGIKWVNDLYFEEKKACGILTEAVSSGSNMLGYVIGIGINLGVSDFPEELSEIACALPISCENREVLLHEILTQLEITLHESQKSLLAYLQEHSIVIGKHIRFFGVVEGEGIAIGLDSDGGLLVRTHENTIISLTTGEISVRLQ